VEVDMERNAVRFPDAARPERSPVYAYNEIDVNAPPERVWAWLVRATRWPEWYANARDVHVEGGAELVPGRRFDWITFGVRVHTVVEEHVPGERLSWSGRGLGASAYHGWVIVPRAGGCRVITEETQRGLVASVGRRWLRRGLRRWHQRWLEGLAARAEAGAPDADADARPVADARA
jgi:hypothetical protein